MQQIGQTGFSISVFVRFTYSYCSHATVPRGVSAHFVRKSRVFQREIASFCDFCASRSVLLVTSSPYWKSLCIFLRIFFRECRSKNADVVVLRRGFLTCAIGEIDRKYAQGFPVRTTSAAMYWLHGKPSAPLPLSYESEPASHPYAHFGTPQRFHGQSPARSH